MNVLALHRASLWFFWTYILFKICRTTSWFPSKHDTSFQRSYDVVLTLWTLHRHWNNVVCVQGLCKYVEQVESFQLWTQLLLTGNSNKIALVGFSSFLIWALSLAKCGWRQLDRLWTFFTYELRRETLITTTLSRRKILTKILPWRVWAETRFPAPSFKSKYHPCSRSSSKNSSSSTSYARAKN